MALDVCQSREAGRAEGSGRDELMWAGSLLCTQAQHACTPSTVTARDGTHQRCCQGRRGETVVHARRPF